MAPRNKRRAWWIIAALIIANEIRGVLFVVFVGWPALAAAFN